MKLPNIKTLNFEQYLNFKRGFVKRRISDLLNTPLKELMELGFENKKEINKMIKFQRKSLTEVNLMLRYQKIVRDIDFDKLKKEVRIK